jgi:KDO2-lipid IV(A) lauroyltransferase
MRALLKDILLWCYWYPLRFFIQTVPPVFAYRLARWGAGLAYYLSPRRRTALERELSDLGVLAPGSREFDSAVKSALVVLFQNETDVLLFPRLNPANIDSFVSLSGAAHLHGALAKGRGVMLLFAHFGANQMIMPAVGHRGYTMCQMSAPPMVWEEKLPNRKFSRMGKRALELRWEHELSLPVKHVNIFRPLKEAFVCLKKNGILGIAIDGGGGKQRVPVAFAGRTALLSTGAVEIALRTGCVVLPTFILRDKGGRQRMIVEEPLQLPEGGDHGEQVLAVMRLFIARFEEYVRRHPGHYLNFLVLRRFMESQGDTPLFV